jgi:predicted Zn-dependent protease with MMP-like domain
VDDLFIGRNLPISDEEEGPGTVPEEITIYRERIMSDA